MSMSSHSAGYASSHGSGASRIPRPSATRVQTRTTRAELELDQPLQHLEEALPPLSRLFEEPVQRVKRGRSYWPADPNQVKWSYRRHLCLGFVLMAVMIGGALFGIVFSLVETHGDFAAANSYIANPNYTDTTTTPVSRAISTTLVASRYSTRVPSRFSTLVASEITIYVQSEDTTSVYSEATTLVPSEITLTQRGVPTTTTMEVTRAKRGNIFKKENGITSTAEVTLSITTTVTFKVYLTTYGRNNLESVPSTHSITQQTCENGAQNDSCTQNTLVPSTLSVTLATPAGHLTMSSTTTTADDNKVTTSTAVTPVLSTMATITTISAAGNNTTAIDQATVIFTDMCVVADISSLLPCNPLPTGWYISPANPRATSFLHSLFRFLSACARRFEGTMNSGVVVMVYRILRVAVAALWTRCVM